mmetsp:Transcript_17137/g.44098  ORF Transcript_17137/g.44098 Transcript_17137/m.44098 type:complete len:246 (-) Transcript_17137:56-793(-)
MVPLVVNHLRREVIQRATERLAPRGWGMHSPAEVRDLQRVLQANQYILRLDVAMDDVLRVAILDRLHHLLEIPRGPRLGEGAAALQQRVELTAWRHLKHKVHALLIVEVAVQPQDVDVPAMRLDLDLTAKLVLHSVLDELVLVQYLERENEACATLACHVDRTKFARPQALSDVNVCQREPWDLGSQGHVLGHLPWPVRGRAPDRKLAALSRLLAALPALAWRRVLLDMLLLSLWTNDPHLRHFW